MGFVILFIWGLVSVLLRAFEQISTEDMYGAMTILLAAMYFEQAMQKRG